MRLDCFSYIDSILLGNIYYWANYILHGVSYKCHYQESHITDISKLQQHPLDVN